MQTRHFITAILCGMAYAATCLAQPHTSYKVVTTTDTTGNLSGWSPFNIYAVDVNNDGIPDLIQDGYYAVSGGFTNLWPVFGVSIANGDGTFKPAVQYKYPPGVLQTPMVFGDFNGDGKVDIAMSAGNYTIAVYLGKGDGTFVNPWYSVVPIASGQTIAPAPFVASDFNHDGKLDLAIVAGDNTNYTVYVLPGIGNGLFSEARPILSVPSGGQAAGWGVQELLPGDFDGDHIADLAVVATTGNYSTGNIASVTVHVLYGAGDFSFLDTAPITSSNYGAVYEMNSGDLNGDSRTDLFALDPNSYRLNTFYGESSRTFAGYTQTLPPAPYYTGQFMRAPQMADFNDDGHMDLLSITFNPDGLVYILQFLGTSSPGQFTLQTWNVLTTHSNLNFSMPAVGDFNHDRKPDWVFNFNSGPGTNSTLYTGLNTTTGGLWSNCDYPSSGRGINMCSPAVTSNSGVNFNATTHSWGDLRKIELWIDGKKLGEQFHAWEGNAWFNMNSTLSPGIHKGAYVAADVDNTLQFFNFQFTIPSNCAAPPSPGVHICIPSSGSTTSANPIQVEASAKITGTLARMEVWVDSTKSYTESDSLSLSAALNVRPGKHTFTVYAVNTTGTVWKSAVSATVP